MSKMILVAGVLALGFSASAALTFTTELQREIDRASAAGGGGSSSRRGGTRRGRSF